MRKKYSSEEEIRIVLGALRGETSIAELCRREGVNPNIYYRPAPPKKEDPM
jgi:transposase